MNGEDDPHLIPRHLVYTIGTDYLATTINLSPLR